MIRRQGTAACEGAAGFQLVWLREDLVQKCVALPRAAHTAVPFWGLCQPAGQLTTARLPLAQQETDQQYLEVDAEHQRDDGCTAVTAVLVGQQLVVAHVGDSRCGLAAAAVLLVCVTLGLAAACVAKGAAGCGGAAHGQVQAQPGYSAALVLGGHSYAAGCCCGESSWLLGLPTVGCLCCCCCCLHPPANVHVRGCATSG